MRSASRPVVRADVPTAAAIGAGVLLAMAVVVVVQTTQAALTALVLGALFGLALDPVATAVQRRLHCSRAVATLVLAVSLVVVIGGILLVLGPQAVDQAGQFADELPETVEQFYSWPLVGDRLEDWDAVGRIETFADELPDRIDSNSIIGIADRLLGGIGIFVLVIVTTTAVLLDGASLVARARGLVPVRSRDRADDIGRIVYESVGRYFAGSITVALLNGLVILTAGLILGIPLAPLAAIWAAITNLIPQIGGLLGGSFFVLLAFTQGASTGAIALAIFLVYQQLENHVIQPTIVGRAIDLTPPTTMLAALIGGAAAGVPGALVATPLVGAVKLVVKQLAPRGMESAAAVQEPPPTDA